MSETDAIQERRSGHVAQQQRQPLVQRAEPARVWVDLASPSHPFFFRALLTALDGVDPVVTVREKTETVPLAEQAGLNPRVLGRDFDNPTLRKLGIPLRTVQLAAQMPACDVALSSRNAMCVLAAKARGIPSIHFTDNDITAHVSGLRVEELYNRFEAMADHSVVPAAFETRELTRWGASPKSIHTYDGYKEDVYVATFEPDPAFEAEELPFGGDPFVVVRPEALDAAYVNAAESLVPDLLSGFVDDGLGVVYLPRGRGDDEWADAYARDEVYVPPEPLDGLQLAWHARCMLTGSGTMAREAACMETPAVSFFPNSLLSVDQALVDEGRIFHSRDAGDVLDYVTGLDASDAEPDLSRSKAVRREVAELTAELINANC